MKIQMVNVSVHEKEVIIAEHFDGSKLVSYEDGKKVLAEESVIPILSGMGVFKDFRIPLYEVNLTVLKRFTSFIQKFDDATLVINVDGRMGVFKNLERLGESS